MKSISVQVTDTLDRRIRIMAAVLDMSRSGFVRAALEERLAQVPTMPGGDVASISIETGYLKMGEDGGEVTPTREVQL